MEPYNISQGLQYLSSQGATLSAREQLALKAALAKLGSSQKSPVYFWGRISGQEDDYYLAYTILKTTSQVFPNKKFFFATGAFAFTELPLLTEEEKQLVEHEQGAFRGKPAHVLGVTEEEVSAEPIESATEESPAKKRATELHRLSHTVRSIDHDTAVVPMGAYLLDDNRDVVLDSTFHGLAHKTNLGEYCHFRPATQVDYLQAEHLDAFQSKFLDTLDLDIPRSSWAIRQLDHGSVTLLRSLLWPGYAAYHINGTKYFGGAYLGHGMKNSDLPFMLM